MKNSNASSETTTITPVWITTIDNPFDPFKNWESWYNFDLQLGYNTPGLVARLSAISDEMSDVDYHIGLEEAINRIIELDLENIYKKVYKKD